MEVASSPPLSVRLRFVRNSSCQDLRPFAKPSVFPFSGVKRFHSGFSLHKDAKLRDSLTCSARTNSCSVPLLLPVSSKCFSISKNQCSALWHHPHRKIDFNRPYYYGNLYAQHRYKRSIVTRSEWAETENSSAVLPLSADELIPKLRGACFYAVTAIVAIVLFQIMLVAHPFVLLLDRHQRKAHHFVAKIWSKLTVAPFLRIQIQGWENLPPSNTPAVFVSNHQSFLDIYTLLTLGRSFKFISKTAIFLYPIIGWAMYLMGTIPLKRMDSRSQLDCLKRCMDLLKKGASVFFFPEGTRSKDGKLGAFKKGAFSVAVKTGVPVVPVTLIGTGKILPAGYEGILNSGDIKVIIHKPLEGSNADALCSEARSTIANSLNC